MSVRVKICGITNVRDAAIAADAGADALGFIFYPNSPRYVTPDAARDIISTLPPFIATVGVFVNESPAKINATAAHCALDVAQLHGDESPLALRGLRPRVMKAFRVKDSLDFPFDKYPVNAFLIDTYVKGEPGGTGERFNWELAREATRRGRIVLAGGLTPENVAEAIQAVDPYGVDVSTGVESAPGAKDAAKVREFVRIAKAARDVSIS